MSSEINVDLVDSPQAAQLKGLTEQLCKLAEKSPSHQMMLLALLATYQAIGEAHPCCTKFAAETALQVGGRLLIKSIEGAPAGSPIH